MAAPLRKVGLLWIPFRCCVNSQSPSLVAAFKRLKDDFLNTLYVHLDFHDQPANRNGLAVQRLYESASNHLPRVDVKVLLHNWHSQSPPVQSKHLAHSYDIIYWSQHHSSSAANQDLVSKVQQHYPQTNNQVTIRLLECGEETEGEKETQPAGLPSFSHVCLGGTFDRLHTGHKVLLSTAVQIAQQCLVVGVTDQSMNQKKALKELILPLEQRVQEVTHFLREVVPSDLQLQVVPISDPLGPAGSMAELQCIVVSEETLKGGEYVNRIREEKYLTTLSIHKIALLGDAHRAESEEEKISSSSGRRRLLGRLLTAPPVRPSLPSRPHVIGLTGGIASGKTTLCKYLESYGAGVIDCDKLGHAAYVKGSEAFSKLCQVFGEQIVDPESGEIDRRKLGAIVFSDKAKLDQLTSVVWPAIGSLAEQKKEDLFKQGHEVVVIDAAVLLEAGWDQMVHEVWTCIIPREEAVKRVMERNKLPESEALKRVAAQMTNEERVSRSHVILCSQWEYEFTRSQVEKAWKELQNRIHHPSHI